MHKKSYIRIHVSFHFNVHVAWFNQKFRGSQKTIFDYRWVHGGWHWSSWNSLCSSSLAMMTGLLLMIRSLRFVRGCFRNASSVTFSRESHRNTRNVFRFGGRAIAIFAYVFIWNNFRLIELPWDSAWTWILCFIFQDFMYYLGHRAVHGNLLI
jgi:sterol desaturase/sphingolipid hydroxylase (fatty acid hydroxylase superfamily)